MLLATPALAFDILQTTNKINFETSETHIITIENVGGLNSNITVTMPANWGYSSGTNCTNQSTTISCSISSGLKSRYIVTSPTNQENYSTHLFNATTNNSQSVNNITFLVIPNGEIFNTLVEFGRGRGNYIYNSQGGGSSSSAGTGYPYIPENTTLELTYLHKTFHVEQYLNLSNTEAANVTYQCSYPSVSVIRSHGDVSKRKTSTWLVNYLANSLYSSWERTNYLTQHYDGTEYVDNQRVYINCTDIAYTLHEGYGNVSISKMNFSLLVSKKDPYNITIANAGDSVTATIINSESYPTEDLTIEWKFNNAITRESVRKLSVNETVVSTIVGKPNVQITLSIQFTPSWEILSYQPIQTVQTTHYQYGVTSSSSTGSSSSTNPGATTSYSLSYICNETKRFLEQTPHYIGSDIEVWRQSILSKDNIAILSGTLDDYATNYDVICLNQTTQAVNATAELNTTLTQNLSEKTMLQSIYNCLTKNECGKTTTTLMATESNHLLSAAIIVILIIAAIIFTYVSVRGRHDKKEIIQYMTKKGIKEDEQ